MNKHASILTLSILTLLVIILGFPGSWKSFFVIIFSLISGYISFKLYRQDITRSPESSSEEKMTTYVDNLNG